MAAGDFLDLQTQLARLAGRPSASDLDDDLYQCKQIINEEYLGCFLIADGRGGYVQPPWAKTPFALLFRAPAAATIGVTQGSKIVTGYSFQADQRGSTVMIGTNAYTYAGQNGSDHVFVEPVTETTGSYSATIYHDSQPLDASSVSIIGKPVLKGSGLLSPMTGRETEVEYRSNHRGDFSPAAGGGYYGSGNGSFFGMNFESGKPLFFHVTSGPLVGLALGTSATIQERLRIYPAPAQVEVVTFDAYVVPPELSGDTDRPQLKGDLVTRILLPMARGRWAAEYKKFAGDPDTKAALITEGKRAKSLLLTLSQTQRRFSGQALAGRS